MALAKAAEPAYGIARLINEGYGKPDGKDETPIDIQYGKLAEWLGVRKHIPTDWRKMLQAIQAAASVEMKSLPADFDQTASVSYFNATEIRDRLAGSAEKGMFGGLKGSAGTWDKIVKAYEKQNIHLAEAGNTLIRNVDFEIPYFKKQAEKTQHQLSDQEHKHEEYLRHAEAATKEFKQECAELGIKGSNIAKELAQLQQQLPGLFQDALANLSSPVIAAAIDHYAAFTAYAHSTTASAAASEPSSMLPQLHAVKDSSLTESSSSDRLISFSTANLCLGGAPGIMEKEADDSANGVHNEIQWDTAGAEPSAPQQLQEPGNDGDAAVNADIDWDVALEPSTQENASYSHGTDAVSPSEDADISWDIDITETAEEAENGDLDVDASKSAPSGLQAESDAHAQAWPESVLRLSADSSFRTAFLDDLYELSSFLLQQVQELKSGGHEALATAAPESIQRLSLSSAQEQSEAVGDLLSKMTSKKVRQLVLIKTSKQYLTRLVRALEQKAGQHDKFLRLARELQAKQEEQERALRSNAPKLLALVQDTGRIKTYVEQAISALYNGRKINVIGEINNVI
ncbi:MAG: hypothetical protein FRX49_04749 [Trebouxia sp. A1-2]|nr:MAG: hypothetical protein FRX49_04749 [Trebouxia sp. A1-2]